METGQEFLGVGFRVWDFCCVGNERCPGGVTWPFCLNVRWLQGSSIDSDSGQDFEDVKISLRQINVDAQVTCLSSSRARNVNLQTEEIKVVEVASVHERRKVGCTVPSKLPKP